MIWTENVSTLVAVVLDDNAPVNATEYLHDLNANETYIVLGEVGYHDVVKFDSKLMIHDQPLTRGIRHYILLELSSGRILPGMYHADRFRSVTKDEI